MVARTSLNVTLLNVHCLSFIFLSRRNKIRCVIYDKKGMGGGYVASVRGRRRIYRLLVVKSERRPLRIPTRKRDDNIKVDLKYFDWENVDWIDLTQDRESSGLL
jgi:hypothetical protein